MNYTPFENLEELFSFEQSLPFMINTTPPSSPVYTNHIEQNNSIDFNYMQSAGATEMPPLFDDFSDLGELVNIFQTIEEPGNINQMIEEPITITPTFDIKLSVYTRDGKSKPWNLSNNNLQKVYKSRKISLTIPKLDNNYTIVGALKIINGQEVDKVCSLSKLAKKSDLKKEIKITRFGDKEQVVDFFLHTLVCNQKGNSEVSYQLSFKITIANGKSKIIQCWNITPSRSHKFESSKKGKIINKTNIEPTIKTIT